VSNELETALFLSGRDAYEAARRWQAVIVLALALFHATLFGPYIGAIAEQAAAQAKIDAATRLEKQIETVHAALDEVVNATASAATTRLGGVKETLIDRFGKLNDAVARLQRMTPEEATGPEGDEVFGAPMQVQNARPSNLLPPLPPEVRAEIARAREIFRLQHLLEVLQPYVKETIVQPVLSSFNSAWQGDGVAHAENAVKDAEDGLTLADAGFPEDHATWTRAKTAIENILVLAKQLRLQEPEGDPFWWATRMGKDETIRGALADVKKAEAIVPVGLLVKLDETTKTAIAGQNARQRELAAQLTDLRERFKEQQAELASFAQPLKVVAIDLGRIVTWFPLVLGLILAGSVIWTAERLRDLRETVALSSATAAAALPARWLARKLGSTAIVVIVCKAAAFVIWIGFAGLQIAGLANAGIRQALSLSVFGSAAVLAASAYQAFVLKRPTH
jgi:hypothetical protein